MRNLEGEKLVIKNTGAYHKFRRDNLAIQSQMEISKMELESYGDDIINHMKRTAARNMAGYLVENNRFHFERRPDLEEDSNRMAHAMHMPYGPQRIYRSEMFVFSREELENAMTDFGADLLQEMLNLQLHYSMNQEDDE